MKFIKQTKKLWRQTLLSALKLILQKLTFYAFHVFFMFWLKSTIFLQLLTDPLNFTDSLAILYQRLKTF